MAYIEPRKRANGKTVYRAQVRVKRNGRVVYSEAKTFERLVVARRWAQRLEAELADPDALARRQGGSGATVARLVRKYLEEVDSIKPIGRSMRYGLELLAEWPIGAKPAAGLKPEDIVEHCRARQAKGTGPATILQDLAFLRSVLGMARPAWGLAVDTSAIDQARPLLDRLGLVSRSRRRDRRPTQDEVDRLMAFFKEQDKDSIIPMADILDFALWTARRQGEIVRLRWIDLNEPKKTCIVRDMKDPRRKKGNDLEFPLLGESWAIIQRQPKTDERIFPYKGESVRARFEKACKTLGIVNLRFHDLRREAASRLFEAGYQIHEVAQVTGHRDLNTLWRVYTKLKPEALHR